MVATRKLCFMSAPYLNKFLARGSESLICSTSFREIGKPLALPSLIHVLGAGRPVNIYCNTIAPWLTSGQNPCPDTGRCRPAGKSRPVSRRFSPQEFSMECIGDKNRRLVPKRANRPLIFLSAWPRSPLIETKGRGKLPKIDPWPISRETWMGGSF